MRCMAREYTLTRLCAISINISIEGLTQCELMAILFHLLNYATITVQKNVIMYEPFESKAYYSELVNDHQGERGQGKARTPTGTLWTLGIDLCTYLLSVTLALWPVHYHAPFFLICSVQSVSVSFGTVTTIYYDCRTLRSH